MCSYDKQTVQFLAVVGQNMPVLTGKQMQAWIQNPTGVAKALSVFQQDGVAQAAEKRLQQGAAVDLPARPEPFTPASYFQTKKSLYVWDGFKNLVLPATREVKDTPALTVVSFDLVKDAIDAQIRAELPEGHVSADPSVFCSHLAGLLERQTGERDGREVVLEDRPLLTDGYANIFYVNVGDRVVAVDVLWGAVNREWRVNAYELDDDTWHAGSRAFSAAAVA